VWLNLSCNQLKKLPGALKVMTGLRWLNLFGNQIEVIEEESLIPCNNYFESSGYSTSIRLGYNKIKKFPLIFTKMKALQELHLPGNDFMEIPEEIGDMGELLVLSNNSNPLTLPNSISKLKKLRKMYLRGSMINIPECLAEVKSLVEVDLSPEIRIASKVACRNEIPLQISLETDHQEEPRFKHGMAKMSSKKNEDRVAVRTGSGNYPKMEYYAVFDGHAGPEVAEYCGNEFHQYLAEFFENFYKIGFKDEGGMGGGWVEEGQEIIFSVKKALQKLEKREKKGSFQRKSSSTSSFGFGDEEAAPETKKEWGREDREDGLGLSWWDGLEGDWGDDPEKIMVQYFHEAFVSFNRIMHHHFDSKNLRMTQGSTAGVAVSIGTFLFCANLGDSRIVLGTADGKAVRLSIDHTPQDYPEALRVVQNRGRLLLDTNGANPSLRVGSSKSQLAVTRAFGDFTFREPVVAPSPTVSILDLQTLPAPSITSPPPPAALPPFPPGVLKIDDESPLPPPPPSPPPPDSLPPPPPSPTASSRPRPISPLNKKFNVLIIACDGVWDVISDQEAVNIVQGREVCSGPGGERDMNKAAVLLRDFAYLKGSTDDISVVCVCLDEKRV